MKILAIQTLFMTHSTKNWIAWTMRLLAAAIMLQTLYFKFSGAPESVYIFSSVGIEPWGRIGTGVMELIASTLILIPATTSLGALLGIGLMSGALMVHIFVIGLNVQGDHGQLFIYALLVLIASLILLLFYWQQLLGYVKKYLPFLPNQKK